MSDVGTFFEQYLRKESLFSDKSILLSSYIPYEVLYREEQMREIAQILAPLLRFERPSNLFIYGKTGTGKTLTVKNVLRSLREVAESNQVALYAIYLNCKLKKLADTEYRLIAQLIKEFGSSVPPTGLPTDEVYNIFYSILEQKKIALLLVLDEIDQLTKKIGDEIFYNLTRINGELKHSKICIIGISNNLSFSENLDPRVKSSLSEEELIFPPYNAVQIQDILFQRVVRGFHESVVQPGVVEKCAAYAARDHGDARRAIDLLRIAGEIAERSGKKQVEISDLDEAEKKVEADKVIHTSINQPRQAQAVLFSIVLLTAAKRSLFTGEIYDTYIKICRQSKLSALTQRRVSDIIAELDMLGIIHAKVLSKGRHGRTREISLPVEEMTKVKLKEVLEKALQL